MQTIKKFYYLLLLVLTVTMLSAYQKKDNPGSNLKKNLLTSNTWQIEEVKAFDQAGIASKTVYKKEANHNAQDFSRYQLTFKADGTYQGTNEAGLAAKGTWKLTRQGTQLNVDNSASQSELLLLTDTQLHMQTIDARTGQITRMKLKGLRS